MDNPSLTTWVSGYSEDAEDVALVEDEVIFAVELDVGAAVLGDEDLVALLDGELDVAAVFVLAAGAEGDDFASCGFSLRGVGDDDAASAEVSSSSMRFTSTRCPSGLMDTSHVVR